MLAEQLSSLTTSLPKPRRILVPLAIRWRVRSSLGGHSVGLVGLVIVVTYWVLAVFGELIAPFPFTEQHLDSTLHAPSATYWFGTDQFGRDIFSRVIAGSRSILLLTTTATALSIVLGLALGLTAGYFGGLCDEVLMRATDVMLSFPALLLALLIISSLGSAMIYLILTIGVVFAPGVARVLRSVVLDLKTKAYLEAAHAIGAPTWRILLRHVLPNMTGAIAVEASIYSSFAILVGAGLGFLGMGVQPPSPDWGLQVNEGRNFILTAPWITIFPSLAISSLVIGVNLLADAVGERMDQSFTARNR